MEKRVAIAMKSSKRRLKFESWCRDYLLFPSTISFYRESLLKKIRSEYQSFKFVSKARDFRAEMPIERIFVLDGSRF